MKQKQLNKTTLHRVQGHMPVLFSLRNEREGKQRFKGLTILMCAHVTWQTAVLVEALQVCGAQVTLIAANPFTMQSDVVTALQEVDNVQVLGDQDDVESFNTYMPKALACKPNVLMDEGAQVVEYMHKHMPDQLKQIDYATEKTTSGHKKFLKLYKAKALSFPTIDVDAAHTKHVFDNLYGTGQSTMQALIESTGRLLAGMTIVVVGYGWCGKGCAQRARGMGAIVIVSEVDTIKALQAILDGFLVMQLLDACKKADIIITATGESSVVSKNHFLAMKDGVIVCNVGHFDKEIDMQALLSLVEDTTQVKPLVNEYTIEVDKKITILAHGNLVNLAIGQGNPSEVLDLTFASQFLALEYMLENKEKLQEELLYMPLSLEYEIAQKKLDAMNIKIDTK